MKDRAKTKEEELKPQVYEIGYLLVPATAEKEVSGKVEVIRKIIESAEGRIITQGDPTLRDLAYEMSTVVSNKKETYSSGYFGWIKFECGSSAVEKIRGELKKNIEIIRFVIAKTVLEDTLAVIEKTLVAEVEEKARMAIKEEEKMLELKNRQEKEERKEKTAKPISTEEIDETIEKLIIE
jgi:ribosomal protein S6